MEDPVSPVAAHVIAKSGGFKAVSDLTGVTLKTVYCWTYPRGKGGTGGRIPHEHQETLLGSPDLGLVPADFFEPPRGNAVDPKSKRGKAA